MSIPPPPAVALDDMDRGRSITVKDSTRFLALSLVFTLLVGAFLVALLILIITSSVEAEVSWALFVFNLRIWAIGIGIIGCFILVPAALLLRMSRAESLVLNRHGIAEARRGVVRPNTTLLWSEIERFQFERPRLLQPRTLSYRLTADAAARRGRARDPWRTVALKKGYELSRRQLYTLLSSAHARYAGHISYPR